MAKLILLSGSEAKEFPLGEAETLGRSPESTIPIPDQKMSSKHAKILHTKDGDYVFQDLGSLNGTTIGGERVRGERLLRDKDEIVVGNTRLRFSVQDDPPQEIEVSVEQAISALEPHVTVSTNEALIRKSIAAANKFLPSKDIADPDALRVDYEKLRISHEFASALDLIMEEKDLLPRILDKAFELLPAERGVILQIDLKTGEPVPRFVKHKDGTDGEIVLSRTLLSLVLKEKAAVLSADAMVDNRFAGAASIVAHGMRSTMCVPLLHGEELLGLIHLDSRVAIDAFTEKDLQILTSIAGQAAMSLANARMAKKIEEQARHREQLQRLLSPALAEQVLQGAIKVEQGGELRQATVLFSDIRGFTAMSEKSSPHDIVVMLNEYFETMVDVLFKHEGTLVSYIGDAMMAVFGAPLHVEDASMKAVRCGWEMQEVLAKFNVTRVARNLAPIEAGIGINSGEVLSGMIGSSRTMQYTTIGDTTNTASRLCSVAKAGQVVLSETVRVQVAERVELEALPLMKLKGKADEQALFRVLSLKPAAPPA